jgi:UDP-N-acetyl-2-amino-2-deoxyglucuronate dehydrogenase
MTAAEGPIRFAIVGCGVIGQTHARSIAALAPDAELILAIDVHAEHAAALASEYGADHSSSLEAALARTDIDAIAICTPSGTHTEIAVAAMAAGKHVMIEKPLDVSLAAASRVAAAQRRTGLTVAVISQHRFDPSSVAVYRAVQDQRLGNLTSAIASVAWWRTQRYYDSGDWRGTWTLDGGGALMNQAIHTLDLLVWILGRPVEVFAWTARLAHEHIEVEDTAVATIRFANGALAVVHATTAAYPGVSTRLQIHGDRGSAIIDNDRLEFFHAGQAAAPVLDYGAAGDGNQADHELPGQGPNRVAASDPGALSDAHREQYRDFLDSISQRREPLVGITDATTTLAVILAIYESAKTGAPVNVDHQLP